MLDLDTLKSLRERVLAANGSKREIDSDFWDVIVPTSHGESRWPFAEVSFYSDEVPHLTSSMDAALALVERMLPDANWSVSKTGGKWKPGFDFSARAARPFSGIGDDEDGKPCGKSSCDAATAPLAILAALLSALIAQTERV